jgi:hypothetical protein
MARSFRQLGMGYGSSPVSIRASIDGSQVFSGTVPTVDQPIPGDTRPVPPPQESCFSWTEQDQWTGTRSFEVVNTGSGIFQLTLTQAIGNLADENSWAGVFSQTVTTPSGDITYLDPFTEVSIDGVPRTKPADTSAYGQWHWNLGPGSSFTAVLNVNQRGWLPEYDYPYAPE